MNKYTDMTFDEERALYGSRGVLVENCRFDGPADGESALKESSDVEARDSYFNLRYPFWHNDRLKISGCEMTDHCRAAIWYSDNIRITGSTLHGIKALRECSHAEIEGCDIVSPEFGWYVSDVRMKDCRAQSEYFMMRSDHLDFKQVRLQGKYSFQYISDSVISDCEFETKDAFWHARNVIIRDSVIRGEYLAWYSENLTFENCEITGTQPLCYCRNLKLVNCRMKNADLAFEKSDVEADITTFVDSIKNPASGSIKVAGVGEIIMDEGQTDCKITQCDRKVP